MGHCDESQRQRGWRVWAWARNMECEEERLVCGVAMARQKKMERQHVSCHVCEGQHAFVACVRDIMCAVACV
eukprot:1165669-Rhodomonas_salina.1